ncbi:MAG: SMI1/KNR4 family protein [Planctomycetes bacterium]|nr:SMI1/KNR4 family protein [Planctomycetota bacterium]
MNTKTPFSSIAGIQNLFEKWRQLGHKKLPCGTELIASVPDGGNEEWVHVVYPGLSHQQLHRLQELLQSPIPGGLRSFYRRCAGMSLWRGAFRVYGYNCDQHGVSEYPRYPDSVLRLNHELDALGWMPKAAFAFAENSWDMSVHVVGLGSDPHTVHRCDRRTGEVMETHPNVWSCIAARLYRVDELSMDPQPVA